MPLDPNSDLVLQYALLAQYWPIALGVVVILGILVAGMSLWNRHIVARLRMIEARLNQIERTDERRLLIALKSRQADDTRVEAVSVSIVPEVVESGAGVRSNSLA
jgi:hypothetical protein